MQRDLTRFSFCPAWHYHPTPEDAAHCPELENAFGPIKKITEHQAEEPMHVWHMPDSQGQVVGLLPGAPAHD